MKNMQQAGISCFITIKQYIEKALGYFEGTLTTMAKVSSKAKKGAEFEDPSKLKQEELTQSEQKELTEFTELFSEVSILWKEKLKTVLEILNSREITFVPEKLADKIISSLCKAAGKAKDDPCAAEFFIKKPDFYKEKWLEEFPAIFDDMIEACRELEYINTMITTTMTVESKLVAESVHYAVKELSSPGLKVIEAKLLKSEQVQYQDIKISEKTCGLLHQLLYEAKNSDANIAGLAEQVKCELNGDLSLGRKLTSWVCKVVSGGTKHSLEFLHESNGNEHVSVISEEADLLSEL